MNLFWKASLNRFDFVLRFFLLIFAKQLLNQINERVVESHDAGAQQEPEVTAKVGQEVGRVIGVVLGGDSIGNFLA